MDLNSALAHGFGVWRAKDDLKLLSLVSSAVVACGFHAGDPSSMSRVCEKATALGVTIGAKVGYRDLGGFGRRRVEYDPGELRDDLLYQLGALSAFGKVRFLKPHGALYAASAVDSGQAAAVVAAAKAWHEPLAILCQGNSVLARRAADAGLKVIAEGFPGRGYLPNGRLAPRDTAGAIINDPATVARRAVRMAVDSRVTALDGTKIPCEVSSLCIHSDAKDALELVSQVRTALVEAGVEVAPFA